MNAVFGVLALYLVVSNAAIIQEPVNYEDLVYDINNELNQIFIDASRALKNQYLVTYVEPIQEVEAALQSINAYKLEHGECVAAHESTIETIADDMHGEMNSCGLVAARTSASIMNDISKATQQLIFDGLDLLRTYQKCKNYKNIVLKNSCFARLTIKATLYTVNARKSIKTLRQSTTERIPAVFVDAEACTNAVSNETVSELNTIRAEIVDCAREN